MLIYNIVLQWIKVYSEIIIARIFWFLLVYEISSLVKFKSRPKNIWNYNLQTNKGSTFRD